MTKRPIQVTRQRRARPRRSGRAVRVVVAAGAVLALIAVSGPAGADTTRFGQRQVGTTYADGIQVSDDQVVSPLGDRLLTQDGKFMGSAVSPNGKFLAASSTDRSVALQVFDLARYQRVWTVGKATTVDEKLSDGSVGQEGPTWSPDGRFLWLPQLSGYARFPVHADGTLGTATTVAFPAVDGHAALPGQAAFSSDGRTLYAPLNGQNTLVALDAASGKVRTTWAVGIAPRAAVLVGTTVFVTNEGGRVAKSGDTTINSYGTDVPADPYLGTSTTGTVSVVDSTKPTAAVGSVAVGLHPTAIVAAGNTVFVANTNGDSVSVIDARNDKVVQTIATQPWPSSTVGYEPDGIATTADGHLLVTLGRANAVDVFRFTAADPREPVSSVGLLPTDYYPADVAVAGGKVVVTNTRGIDARGPDLTFTEGPKTTPATGHGTHSTTASLTRFTLPSDQQTAKATTTVFRQNGWGTGDVTAAAGTPPAAVPVPRRLGDPSTIQHVFLLVKENRTYDQLYGDDARGNGDASLAQFGERVTPNQHALEQQFGLYDNTYDVGTNSAEGHNWLMQGDNPEYTESNAGTYERSYDTEDDVLGHQRSGFLWTAVESAGRTAKDYGEFTQFESKPNGATWQQYYCAAQQASRGNTGALFAPAVRQDTESPIPSLNAITDHDYPKFDTDIPDQYRFQVWNQDFQRNGPAALNMFWLSSDHTGGAPDPVAQVADNDLAVGKIVDTISHSPYWASSAIFVVEDDSQNGADHVDGHRAPVQVISPWAAHGVVDSTYYTQLTMVRTIEQILGAQPLNQKLAAATPMYGAFRSTADLTPFDFVQNRTPLTQGVTPPPSCGNDRLGTTGTAAAQVDAQAAAADVVPAAQRSTAAAWAAWAAQRRFTGDAAVPDYADPEQMNRWTWYRTTGWTRPYPGDSRIYAPDAVPAGYLPSADTDGG